MAKFGKTDLVEIPAGQPIPGGNPKAGAAYAANANGRSKTYYREHMTYYEMIHEFFHFMDHSARGQSYIDPSNAGRARRETFVWSRMKDTFWQFLNDAEQANADQQMGQFVQNLP